MRLLNKLFISTVFISGISFAQKVEDFPALKEKYKGNNIIQTLRKVAIKIDLMKNVPKVSTSYIDEYLAITNLGAQSLTDDYIEFTSSEEISEVEAYSLVPNGSSLKKVKATGFKTEDAETEGSIFHDGGKKTSMLFGGLTEGAYRHLSYTSSRVDYKFPFGMYFAAGVPVIDAIYEIDHDTAIHLSKALFNMENVNIKFEEKVVKSRRIWRWTLSNIEAVKTEDQAPRFAYYVPSVFNQISHINLKSGKTSVLSSLQDLFDWYVTTVENVVEEAISDDLKQLAADLTKDKKTDLEKVKAVYYWVQDNIKYIAFEEGVNGYIPRKPSLVYEKRYGDCKDMATLIHGMLESVGVKTHLAWIGSRDLPYKYSEFPSSIVDNHMIAIYKEADKHYFLDATSSFQPITYPTGFIQNKEALMWLEDKKYELVTVPTPSFQSNFMIDTAFIKIDNRSITGIGHTEFQGYYNIYFNERFKDVPNEKVIDKMKGLVHKGNNSIKLTEASVKNVSDKDQNLHMNYGFKVDNYVTSYEKEVYLNMILEKQITLLGDLKDRKNPIEFEFLSHDSYTVAYELNDQLKLKSIPKNVNYSSDVVDFSVTYRQVGKTIYMTLIMDVKTLYIYQNQFSQWNEFVKQIKKAINETVVLEKI